MYCAVESPIGIVLVKDVVSAFPENSTVRIVHPVGWAYKVVCWTVRIGCQFQTAWVNVALLRFNHLSVSIMWHTSKTEAGPASSPIPMAMCNPVPVGGAGCPAYPLFVVAQFIGRLLESRNPIHRSYFKITILRVAE